MKRFLFVFCYALIAACNSSPEQEEVKPAQTIAELKTQLEKILKDTKVPGMSVAIARRDRIEFAEGLGLADVVDKVPATAQTRFRIGSTSKAFVSLSILKLASEGKLSLLDSVRKLAPEVWFENKWEATNPVLVVDLLEHTTGFDDMHLREYVKNDASLSLKDALDYDHSSRISRWRPGTRMAYSNSGPAVAAYIVEKISGQRFEDYVQKNFFNPIGMHRASYFYPNLASYCLESYPPQCFEPKASQEITKLYHSDGVTPFAYWNVMYRPSGAINASAEDMAKYVQFYLNRGSVGGVAVMPDMAIARMQTPTRTWAAQQGLKAGYGLSSYTAIHEGRVYHGHNGGVSGGLTDMSYLPDDGVGYFYSINGGNPGAFRKIGKAIRAYITRDLPQPVLLGEAQMPNEAPAYSGWYEFDSPRNGFLRFLDKLLGLVKIEVEDHKMIVSSLSEQGMNFVPVKDSQFREIPKKDPPEPAATAMLLKPNEEGRFVQIGNGMQTLRKIPTWLAWFEIFVAGLFAFAVDSVLLYAPFWLIGGIFRKRRRPSERGIRLWPLLAVLSLVVAFASVSLAGEDFIEKMGSVTIHSVTFFIATLLYAALCAASAIAVFSARQKPVRFLVRLHAIVSTVGLCSGALYLAYWGVIGYRPWG